MVRGVVRSSEVEAAVGELLEGGHEAGNVVGAGIGEQVEVNLQRRVLVLRVDG